MTEAEPFFGQWLRGIYADEECLWREGMFVETIYRTGVLNPGKFYRLTDGAGKFWEFQADATVPAPFPIRNKEAINAFVSRRYDELMAEGKHGHYETMYKVLYECMVKARDGELGELE